MKPDSVEPLEPQLERIIKEKVDNSSYYKHLGVDLLGLSVGTIAMELKEVSRCLDAQGKVHNGAIAGLADVCAEIALDTVLSQEESGICVEQKVNFLKPADPGKILGRGRIVQRGERIAVIEVEVTDENEGLLAKGMSTYLIKKQVS